MPRLLDRSWINIYSDTDVEYWSQRWGVSRKQLLQAVHEVGARPEDVGRRLRESSPG